jgi:hypothetical protein
MGGWFTTTILAVKATPGYLEELEEEEPDNVLDKGKIVLKHYKWAILTGTIATGCGVASTVESNHRLATALALASTYENELIEQKDKVKELFGERKQEKVEESIAEDHAQKVTIDDKHMIHLGTGTMLTMDDVTGQVFYADRDYINKKFIDLNDFLLVHKDEGLTLNDYTYILGIETPKLIGDSLLWRYDIRRNAGEQIVLFPTSCLRDGEPIFVIGHRVEPRSEEWYRQHPNDYA